MGSVHDARAKGWQGQSEPERRRPAPKKTCAAPWNFQPASQSDLYEITLLPQVAIDVSKGDLSACVDAPEAAELRLGLQLGRQDVDDIVVEGALSTFDIPVTAFPGFHLATVAPPRIQAGDGDIICLVYDEGSISGGTTSVAVTDESFECFIPSDYTYGVEGQPAESTFDLFTRRIGVDRDAGSACFFDVGVTVQLTCLDDTRCAKRRGSTVGAADPEGAETPANPDAAEVPTTPEVIHFAEALAGVTTDSVQGWGSDVVTRPRRCSRGPPSAPASPALEAAP